jgi:hypothetical protein
MKTLFYKLSYFMIMIAFILSYTAGCRYLSIPPSDDIADKPVAQKGKIATPNYNSAVIKGSIVRADKAKDSTLIMAYRLDDGDKPFTEYVAVGSQDAFMLYLPEGRYNLYTFTDFNRNGVYEEGEISGIYGSAATPKEISIREGELITGVIITTGKASGQNIKRPLDLNNKDIPEIISQQTQNGQVLKIYHEYFSPGNAQTGYWNPSAFMKAFGAHIYMTEEYNPRKIPVLFVHGTEGSPQNWIYFNMRMDRSRYQLWFFYYPSGIRLTLAATLLNEELRELRDKYGFQKMGLVAHSVGGLTTRSFLTRFSSDNQNNFVKLYVTFATPWSGFTAADASQIITHKSIPVWVDLGTQSAFIKTTMESKLPPQVKHYIFYGKNDKLSGDKALDDRAVAGAAKTCESDCTHDTILSDRRVFTTFNAILDKELWQK